MSGWEKYVERAADEITYHPGNRTGTPESRHAVSVMLARAVLSVVGPLIEEDTRDRMVTAAGRALEREGSFTQRERVAEEIAHALEARRAHYERAIRRAEALGQPTVGHIASAVEFQMAANEAREIGRRS